MQFLRGAAIVAAAALAPAVVAGRQPLVKHTSAGREPVLKQIRVPHNYYYREMYLPQATSGPSAVAWSPDGAEVVYSMQGSLWRQRLDGDTAVQLTAGPGYAYQPDWSPDGRFVAYAYYVDDQIELRVLDVGGGGGRADAALVRNGAVNVEPRWSPDGKRAAFVSTAYEGRWHVYTVDVRDGRAAGDPERLTVDTNSHLPRYYYSVYDHYLSPTWSPDGRELIVVSNRGHVWGSGGFWRMAARAGAPMREIHYEETTWRARPDWSPDGKRVVYSSYLGRQRNQLWLMTADGGDPFQLTYGDYDATAPRWSRDGRHVAYISNEGGNTALRVVDVPGGARRRIEARHRVYRDAVGTLRIAVIDRATGRPVPARVSVSTADGRSFAPDDAWRHADDGFDRAERKMEYGYFHAPATSVALTVPAESVTVEVTRGLEYRVARRAVAVRAGETTSVRVALDRLDDLPAKGWYSADLHVHMNYGGHYRATPATLAAQARAEDLHVVEDLIVNKEGRVPDVAYFTGRPDPVSTSAALVLHDQEYHTSYWGHTGLLGLTRHLVLPGYAAYVNTAAASLYPMNADVFDVAHAQGAVAGYVHPLEEVPNPADTSVALTDELPADVALGVVDYMEVVGFSDHRSTAEVWYRLLNCGFRIPAGAGTDAMTNFASLRGPVGMNRVYVKVGAPLTRERFLGALKAGRTFATNGPLLSFAVDGHGAGDELRLPAGRRGALRVRVGMRSIVPVEHLEVVSNGAVVAAVPLAGDRTSADTTLTLPVERSGWYTLRAWSEHATHPVLDIYPFATTSPVYVTVGGGPVRSARDAAYFVAWVDRLAAAARAHPGWNDERERSHVLERLARAREELVRRGGAEAAASHGR